LGSAYILKHYLFVILAALNGARTPLNYEANSQFLTGAGENKLAFAKK
jgi:hypothetical protein